MPTNCTGSKRAMFWKKLIWLLTMALILPLFPLFAVAPTGGGDGGDGGDGDDDGDPGDTGDGDDDAGDDFDKDRAMATITKLRGLEKTNKAELKAAQARLAELEKAEKKRKEAELSDKERLEGEIQELKDAQTKAEQTATDREAQVKQRLIRAEVRIVATELGFTDPSDAYKVADLSSVEIDDEGQVTGVKKVLEKLAKDKPYLLQAGSAANRGLGTPPRGGSGGKSKGPTEPVPVQVNF